MARSPHRIEATYPIMEVSKAEYDELAPLLRSKLLAVQYELRDADFPFLLIIGGVDDVAGHVVNRLHRWLDARFVHTTAFLPPSDEEAERPFAWRFWREFAPRGRTSIYLQGWTVQSVVERITGVIGDSEFANRLSHIRAQEKMLRDGGAVILKIWLQPHNPGSHKKRRKSSPLPGVNVWTAAGHGKRIMKHYEEHAALVGEALNQTSTEAAPWYVFAADEPRAVELAVGELIHDVLTERLEFGPQSQPEDGEVVDGSADRLAQIDLAAALDDDKYHKQLKKWQKRLGELTRLAYDKGTSLVLVFEGWDAAGKGGAIRRVTEAIDAALYRVVPIAAPTQHELAYHYLWRFWQHIPRPGRVVVFDRSWYGRVLVERVEGIATEEEWRRAYAEIGDFEAQLVESGAVLLKFWVHVSPEVQLDRFKERENVSFKKYKITREDYRNRDKRAEYSLAANEMIALTDSKQARWHLVAGDDKLFARIEVIKRVCKTLAAALGV